MRIFCLSLLLILVIPARAGSENPFSSSFQQLELQRLQYYRSKAHQGDAHAQFRLGWAYETGDGLPQDSKAANHWYQRAAQQGHMNARLNLVLMDKQETLALAPEEKEFLDVFEQARSGDRAARLLAARRAVTGGFTRPELGQIYQWLKELADDGDPESQHLLGTFYIQGRGVPQNFVRAYSWFSVAAASGYAGAVASRDAVAHLMSASQLEQGQALSMAIYEKQLGAVSHPETPELDVSGNVSKSMQPSEVRIQ